MKKLILLLITLSSINLFAQDYDVAFDLVPWNASGNGVTLSNDTVYIDGDADYYPQYHYTLTPDPNMDDLYFTAWIYMDNVVEGSASWDKPKMRIETTGGGKIINWNIPTLVQQEWVQVGVKIDNFDNQGYGSVVLKFGLQNSSGILRVTKPFVSSNPTDGVYKFPFTTPADPTVTLDVNTDQFHFFRNDILSTNCHFSWATYNWEDQNVKDAIYQKFPMRNLRFPGGTVANFYDWTTDDFMDNTISTYNGTANTGRQDAKKFGYPGYADVCKTLGGNSTLLMNVMSDDVATSQARLQSRLDDGLDVKYIEMGNENYFPDQAYGQVCDTSYLYGNNNGDYTDEYIAFTKDLYTGLKAIHPDALIAVNTHDVHWDTPLAADPFFDACVMHNYIFPDAFMMNQFAAAEMMQAYRTTQSRLTNYVSKFGTDKPILMSEWGILSGCPASFTQVMSAADDFLSIEKGAHEGIVAQAGIHMLYHGDFIGEGSLIMHNGTEIRINPIGVMYSKLYEVFLDHKVYDAYSTATEVDPGLYGTYVKAIDAGDSVLVYVVNKLPVDAPLNLTFDRTPYSGDFKREVYQDDMTDVPGNFSLTENPWVTTNGTGAASIPAESITIYTIQKSDIDPDLVCNYPELGPDLDLCGVADQTLDSQLPTTNTTFAWYKDDVLLATETRATMSADAEGVYTVISDSLGCIRSDDITVTAVLPEFYLGPDTYLCTSTSRDLVSGVNPTNKTFTWTLDGVDLPYSTSTVTAYAPGTYELTVSATGCSDKTDEVIFTSELIDVTFDTICVAGEVTLTVNEATGDYAWYDQATNGTELSTATTYQPDISASTTYYVQNNTVNTYNIGRSSSTGTIYGENADYSIWGRTMYMNLEKGLILEQFDVYNNDSDVDLYMEISGPNGTFVITETGMPATGSSGTPHTVVANQFIPAGDYIISFVGTVGRMYVQVSDREDAEIPGLLEFGGTDGSTHYGFLYNLVFKEDNSLACSRTPVEAVIDVTHPDCAGTYCDFTSGGIGGFNDAADMSEFNMATSDGSTDYGSYCLNTTDVKEGTGSLQVDVTADHSWAMRMFNTGCDVNVRDGFQYKMEFWIKGTPGSSFTTYLFANVSSNNLDQTTLYVETAGWEKHSVILQADESGLGGVKLSFAKTGQYLIDDLTVVELDCSGEEGGTATLDGCGICSGGNTGITPDSYCSFTSITPDNTSIYYHGILSEDINATRAILHRFSDDFLNDGSDGTWSQPKAETQSGITVEFQTNSPIVTMKFSELVGSEQRASNFAVFKDGELYQEGITDSEFTFTNFAEDDAVWTVSLPNFNGIQFDGIDLVDGYSLTPITQTPKSQYFAIGNSITHGVGQENSSHLTYPYLIADSLGYELHNLGIGGSRISEHVLTNLVGQTPDVISVLWGYNDVNNSADLQAGPLDTYESLIDSICKSQPQAKVMVITQTPTHTTIGGNNPGSNDNTIAELRAEQEAIITTLQATYPNLYKVESHGYVSFPSGLNDDVHLNTLGAYELAMGIIKEINDTDADITQTITLEAGWNLISTNVHVELDSTIETLFIGLDVAIIKDADGFWKEGQASELNSLTHITAGEGYLVYMNNPGTLSIAGQPVQTHYSAPLPGWQMQGCKYQTITPFATDFNAANTEIIKNFDGFFEPGGGPNSIINLEPGKGYYVKGK